MSKVKFALTCILISACSLLALASGSPNRKSDKLQIGAIDYFGYAGLDLKQVQNHLPLKVGDWLDSDSFDHDHAAIQSSVRQSTGKPATDIAMVCCDQSHRLLIYIGLSGSSSHPLVLSAPPQGNEHLNDLGVTKLYKRFGQAFVVAVRKGDATEDDSQGYALSADPVLRQIELNIRAYAVSHTALLEHLLQDSSSAEQRRASAWFLGYSERSAAQIQHLTEATRDEDAEVRDNALRALWVLATAKDSKGIAVNPAPFVEQLFSGQWTDRNKSSLLLMRLVQDGNTTVLSSLRQRAIEPLIEGARWTNPGHSSPFVFLLGRVEGIPQKQLPKLMFSPGKSQIIDAAERLLKQNG